MSRGELLALLERLQWGECDGWQQCSECGAFGPLEHDGTHQPGCKIQQAIDELRASGDLHVEIV